MKWFSTWFDSPYYHILYEQRDEDEAAAFITSLQNKLALTPGARVLDAACGKGRHAITLEQLGFSVDAFDLSTANIESATVFENKNLLFFVHDLREPLPLQNQYDAIFNFFTSFGYFDAQEDNKKMLHAIAQMLDKNSLLLIDFMNAKKVIIILVPAEDVIRDTLSFDISRIFDGTHIFKDIQFSEEEEDFHYTERVQALYLEDFKALLEGDFEILHTFGDFELNAFDASHSDRLILIAKRK